MRSVEASLGEMKRIADAMVGGDVTAGAADYYQKEDEGLEPEDLRPSLEPTTDVSIKSGYSNGSGPAGQECEVTLRSFSGAGSHRQVATFDRSWNLTGLIVGGVDEGGESYFRDDGFSEADKAFVLDAMVERLCLERPDLVPERTDASAN